MSGTNETADGTEQHSGESASSSDDSVVETRRNAAKFFAALGGAAAIGSFALNGLTGVYSAAEAGGGKKLTYKTMYGKGVHLVNAEGDRIKVGAIPKGSGNTMTVFPEKKGGGALKRKVTSTLLIRYSESAYKKPTKLDWTTKGYAAYSKVCTHAGCLVGGRKDGNFYCPCHGSVFAPKQGAKVVGGPAPRPLPQLPIGVSKNGKLLVATGHFEAPIGP